MQCVCTYLFCPFCTYYSTLYIILDNYDVEITPRLVQNLYISYSAELIPVVSVKVTPFWKCQLNTQT